jgi:hypothetical protein
MTIIKCLTVMSGMTKGAELPNEVIVKDIEKSLDEYVKSILDGGFCTGWILISSMSSPQHDSTSSDGYFTLTSQGLPHHAQLGLLQVAQQDKQSESMIASITSMMGNAYGEEDE